MKKYVPKGLPPRELIKTTLLDVLGMAKVLETFTYKDLSELLSITSHDALVRVYKLRKWRLIKILKRTRPAQYMLTAWGHQYLDYKETEALAAQIEENEHQAG